MNNSKTFWILPHPSWRTLFYQIAKLIVHRVAPDEITTAQVPPPSAMPVPGTKLEPSVCRCLS